MLTKIFQTLTDPVFLVPNLIVNLVAGVIALRLLDPLLALVSKSYRIRKQRRNKERQRIIAYLAGDPNLLAVEFLRYLLWLGFLCVLLILLSSSLQGDERINRMASIVLQLSASFLIIYLAFKFITLNNAYHLYWQKRKAQLPTDTN